jgi:hypothetical protein
MSTHQQCSVCFENIGENNVSTLECGHTFHYTCIFRWNRRHANCPCCRQNINTDNSITDNSITDNSITDNSGGDTHVGNENIPLVEGDVENNVENNVNRRVHQINAFTVCSYCNHEVIYCEDCEKDMCYCSVNRTTRNGVNPFHNIHDEYNNISNDGDNISNDEDNTHYHCLDCFNKRDVALLDILTDDWEENVFDMEFVIEMYETYYINRNRTNIDTDEPINFNNYNDFVVYAEELMIIELAAQNNDNDNDNNMNNDNDNDNDNMNNDMDNDNDIDNNMNIDNNTIENRDYFINNYNNRILNNIDAEINLIH